MKFFIVEPSPFPILIPLEPIYSPQDPVFKGPEPAFPPFSVRDHISQRYITNDNIFVLHILISKFFERSQ